MSSKPNVGNGVDRALLYKLSVPASKAFTVISGVTCLLLSFIPFLALICSYTYAACCAIAKSFLRFNYIASDDPLSVVLSIALLVNLILFANGFIASATPSFLENIMLPSGSAASVLSVFPDFPFTVCTVPSLDMMISPLSTATGMFEPAPCTLSSPFAAVATELS